MEYLKYFENKTSAEGYKTESWFVGYLDEEDLVLYSGGGEVIKDGEMVMDEVTLAGRTFPNNVIAYISMDGNPIEFVGTNFSLTCIESVFDSNTKVGQWIFDADVTKLGALLNLLLKELYLPETITTLYTKYRIADNKTIFYNTICKKLYYNCINATWQNSTYYGFDKATEIEELIIGTNVQVLPTLCKSKKHVSKLILNTIHPLTGLFTGLKSILSPARNTIQVSINNQYIDSRNNCNAIIDSTTNELLVGTSNTIIPETVTSIGENAFLGCELSSFIVPENVLTIKKLAFAGSTITNIILSNGLTTIYEEAFKSANLSSIIIPDTVKSIREGAFDSSSLVHIQLSNNMAALNTYVLRNCANLKTVIFGDNIKTIDSHAFTNSGMERIILPDSVETINFSAFLTCLNLTDLTFGKNTTTIDTRACYRCEKLENIYYNGTKSEWFEIDKYSNPSAVDNNWNYNVPATVVHCIDGDVTL